MENKSFDVLCVGHASWDLIFEINHQPHSDEKMFAESLSSMGGGPAANAAVAVARLGGKSAFMGYLGTDDFGDMHLQEFEREGVYTDYLFRGKQRTPVSSIYVKPDGQRSVVNWKADVVPQSADSISKAMLESLNPRVILFDGHEPEISRVLCEWAKEKQITTLLDAGSLREGTRLLADKVDVLAASSAFAKGLCGDVNPTQALSKLSELNDNVIITYGDQGLVWQRDGETGELPAFHVTAVDTTGAGDAFHGALAFAVSRDMLWKESLAFASAAAALCCTKLGARIGLPDLSAVYEIMGK